MLRRVILCRHAAAMRCRHDVSVWRAASATDAASADALTHDESFCRHA